MPAHQPFALLGLGGVGRTLLRQIIAHRDHHARYGVNFALAYMGDSTGGLLASTSSSFDNVAIEAACAAKEAGSPLSALSGGEFATEASDPAEVVRSKLPPGCIVVDCTASDATLPALLAAVEELEAGKVVSANKKPFTSGQDAFERLTSSPNCRWESTVGAGLPVIASLSRVVRSGDPINSINGAFSGSLGFIMTGLQAGQKLSAVVREARSLGYTEPDPRDDLSGMDVARKALILHRMCGGVGEMSDVAVEGLYPPSMDDLSVDDFMGEALESLDAPMEERIAACAAQGQVLRFGASIEGGACRVGPLEVDGASPLGLLSGTNNIVQVDSEQYHGPASLVVQGPGAGFPQTAGGVLADMVELAR